MALSRLAAARAAAGLALSLLLAGCASGAGDAPPTGVDQLDIPTPSPDPRDFVDTVDNPWLPLTPGATWVYEQTGEQERTVTVTVEGTRDVAGVTATEVSEVVSGGRREQEQVRWFAQDTSGNVWLLGEEGAWEAGTDGAEAGLAMPAMPRLGDGYRQEYAAGVAEDQAEVVDLEGTIRVPLGEYDALLVVEQRSDLEPGLVERYYYARGTGLVYVSTVSGGSDAASLVEVSGVA